MQVIDKQTQFEKGFIDGFEEGHKDGMAQGYKQLAKEINTILKEEPGVYDFIGKVIPKIKEILADTKPRKG